MQASNINEGAGWYARPYQQGDEEQLCTLYGHVFGRSRSEEVWRWKLAERQPSCEFVWVAVQIESERVIGQYAGIPIELKLGERTLSAVHAVESMTGRGARKQGVLTRLGSAAHASWAKAGYAAVLGLPNQQWGSRTRALGYSHLFPLAWLRFPLHLERVLSRQDRLPRSAVAPAVVAGTSLSTLWRGASRWRMRMGRSEAITVEEVTSASPEFDDLWSRLLPSYPNALVRSSEWVDWRYLRAATYHYTVLLARRDGAPSGYIAYRLGADLGRVNGYIADLFVPPDDRAVASALLLEALSALSRHGAGMVLATAVPGSLLHALYRSLGFWPAAASTSFSFELAPFEPGIDIAALSDPRSWLLTAGDFDVI